MDTPLYSCWITATQTPPSFDHRAMKKLHRDGEYEKDEHAPFFMLLSLDYGGRTRLL